MSAGNKRSEMKTRMIDYNSHESSYRPYVNSMEGERSIGHLGEEYSPDIVDTLRSLRVDIRSCKVDNNKLIEAQKRLVRAQEKQ